MLLLRNEWSLSLHAVTNDCMIPFDAYAAAETPNAFQWARQSPKFLLPVGDIDSHLTHGSLGPNKSTSKQHLDRFSCLLYSTSVWPTYRQTISHASCEIYCNRPHNYVLCMQCSLIILDNQENNLLGLTHSIEWHYNTIQCHTQTDTVLLANVQLKSGWLVVPLFSLV